MKKQDIGIVLIFLTWIIPITYSILLMLEGQQLWSLETGLNIGKNPTIFLIDLILFYSGFTLIINGLRGNKEKIKEFLNYIYFIPILNILIAFLYSLFLQGINGIIKIFSEALFISIYNFSILLTLITVDIKIKTPLINLIKDTWKLLILILEFGAYAILVYIAGPSFLTMMVFIALLIITALYLYR